jgi:hypothetical protein
MSRREDLEQSHVALSKILIRPLPVQDPKVNCFGDLRWHAARPSPRPTQLGEACVRACGVPLLFPIT